LSEAPRTFGQLLGPPPAAQQIVIDATNVLVETMNTPGNSIPQSLLAGAQAIAIIPNTLRGAFVFGVQHGRGVLVIRDGTGTWQAPRMIQITGGSFGYQIGIQSSDLVLVFRTQQSVANLLAGTLKIGVGASAAAGPVGRQAAGAGNAATFGGPPAPNDCRLFDGCGARRGRCSRGRGRTAGDRGAADGGD
jgi:lipid-binding SYLF domain-containing protein